MKKLAILICSLYKRERCLNELLTVLNPQIISDVEIIIEKDNGELKVGAKRNLLIDKTSDFQFCSFIDDDDLVSPNYVSKILKALESNPDCIGIEGIITFNGNRPKKFIHSMKYSKWDETQEAYLRYPNHLNPIKTNLVKQVRFPETNYGEDKDFSDRIYPLLKTEVYIPEPIYFYLYDDKKSATKDR